MRQRRKTCLLALATAAVLAIPVGVPSASAATSVSVLHVGQIAEQNVEPQPGSEPDTLVEPDIGVSPVNHNIAVAAAHNGRFPDGGAVGIAYAWTRNGGATWHHSALPHLTKATGGRWERASDPVVAFGPEGDVYISTLVFGHDCPSGVAVSRSTDGGATFGKPVLAHYTPTCDYSDDKNWLVVDTGENSPYKGRLYQFWTPFLGGSFGEGSLQVVRWSDDHGQTWSKTVNLTEPGAYTQNSQAMIQPDGTIVDAYLDFGAAMTPHSAGPEQPQARQRAMATRAAAAPSDTMVARISRDGGATWSAPVTVTEQVGWGPEGIRCCLPSGTSDPVTGRMFLSWISPDSRAVMVTQSLNGSQWSDAVPAAARIHNHDYINTDVAAYGDTVYVASSMRDLTKGDGRYAQQQLSTAKGGLNFGPPIKLGPPSDLKYAAYAGGIFPGDYMGSAATKGRYYSAWCLSSKPPEPDAVYHQTMWAATAAT